MIIDQLQQQQQQQQLQQQQQQQQQQHKITTTTNKTIRLTGTELTKKAIVIDGGPQSVSPRIGWPLE